MEKQFLLVRIIWLARLVLDGLEGWLLWVEALVNQPHGVALILANCVKKLQNLNLHHFVCA
jgi:hypothetical protein